MPLVSRAQHRFFRFAEAKGILPKGTTKEWEEHTPNLSKLPERVGAKPKNRSKKASLLLKLASEGDATAQLVIELFKQAAVGRHEGYGATNSMTSANSSLLSAASLAKPNHTNQPALKPGMNSNGLGQLPMPVIAGPSVPNQQTQTMPATGVTARTPGPGRV